MRHFSAHYILFDMKQLSTLILITLFSITQTEAQVIYNSSGRSGNAQYRQNQTTKGFDVSKIGFGGSFELGLAHRYFRGGIAPFIGYRFNDYFSAGLSTRFQYSSLRDEFVFPNSNNGYDYKPWRFRYYGPGIWARATILNTYFLQVDYEYNFMDEIAYQYVPPYSYQKVKNSYTAPSLIAGLGYNSYIANRISIFAFIGYDVLQNIPANMRTVQGSGQRYSLSPYAGQLVYRAGISFGL